VLRVRLCLAGGTFGFISRMLIFKDHKNIKTRLGEH
jgi:hypothetical protein